MLGSRSAIGVKITQIPRLSKAVFHIPATPARALSAGTSGADGGKEKPPGKKRGAYIAGGIAALGGLAYAYRLVKNDKYDPMEPFNWAKEQLGLAHKDPPKKANPVPAVAVETKGRGSLGSDSKANCAEKDSCKDNCEDSQCLHKMDKEEEMIAKTNAELEKALKDVKPKATEATEVALKAYCEAVEAIKIFMDKAYCAMEEDNLDSPRFEEVWCEVYEAALKRCEKVKDAIIKGQCAWELLCRLREIIENGKTCKYTSCNPLLITAEETLMCAERELLNAKAKMDCVQSESRLVEQYKNVVEDFRRDLKAELESLLTTNPECRTNLTDNECAMILTHAYKKVLRIQKELALTQAKGIAGDLVGDMDLPDAQKKLDEIRTYYEAELVKVMARQSHVHYDAMELSKELLRQDYERRLKQSAEIAESEHLVELRAKYTIASSALAAMQEVLSDRKEVEERSEKLRKLWTYCSTLYNRINFGNHFGGDGTISVNKEKLLAEFSSDEFSLQLLKTIPEKIESMETLRARFFNRIDRTCRNVGVFRDGENISLGKYMWGYIQGRLTTRCEGEKESVSTIYEILDKTAYHLRQGELLEAVLTLNQTEGPARAVCKDWLSDARGVLEASQTLFALMTHANAQNQRSF